MSTERPTIETSKRPLHIMAEALTLASQGKSPYLNYGGESSLFRTTLIAKLGLAGDKKDGKPLMARLVNLFRPIKDFRQVLEIEYAVDKLLHRGLVGQTNHHQESLGADLAAIAARQFEREGSVCAGVSGMILLAPERFLVEFPGLKERVFEKDIDQAVKKGHGKVEEGRMVSHAILSGFGLTPPIHEDFILPTGRIFAELEPGSLQELDTTGFEFLTEEARSEALEGTAGRLPIFWIQRTGEQSPHRLIQVQQRRFRR